MINKQLSLILLTTLIIAGCSNTVLQSPRDEYANAFITPDLANQALAKKVACCDNFSQLQYQDISDNNNILVPISRDSQVYPFATGNSFVQAYKLTSKATELKLHISSLIYNTVIAPQITLLDANFNITRTIQATQFSYKEARLLGGDRLSAELTIFRPQANNLANETYLLFHTTDVAIAATTTIVHPAKSFAKATSTVEPNVADPVIPHSAMGVIVLEIENRGTAADEDNSYLPLPTVKQDEKPVMRSELEFNQAIITAVAEDEIDKALTIVEQAEAAGSTTARKTFIDALK